MSATSGTSRPKIEYVMFDMDGLMIDSERIYTEVTNKILAEYGKEMTWDIKAGLMGKPEREAATHLLSFFPDISLTIPEYLERRDALQDLLWPTVQPLPGVVRLVTHLHKHKIPIAIATGTRQRNFALKTTHLQDQLFGKFNGAVVCGDDERLAKEGGGKVRGKPFADIFVVAAREALGRGVGKGEISEGAVGTQKREERGKGLIFEDAIPGVQAGKRAGMNVVWVPDPNLLGVEYSGVEQPDQVLRTLEDFVPEEWGLPPYDS